MDQWLPWLLIGLIAGWLLEYLIDVLFWRPRMERLQLERDRVGHQVESAQSGLLTLRERLRSTEVEKRQLEQERYAVSERLHIALRELKTLRTQHEAAINLARQHENEASLWRARTVANDAELESVRARTDALQQSLAEAQKEIVRLTYYSEAAEPPVFTSPPRRDPLDQITGIGRLFAERLNAAGITTFEQLSQQTPEALRAIIQPQPWQKIEPDLWVAEAVQRLHDRRTES